MITIRIILTACILSGVLYSAQAQEVKKTTGDTTKSKTIKKTIKVNSPADLQKALQEILSEQQKGKQNSVPEQQKQKDSTYQKGKLNLRLHAKSVINQKAPEIVVEEWLSGKPDVKGKFVLIDFWATTCGPCKALIPKLNEWSEKYKNDLVIIGISNEKAERVKAMKGHVIEYYNAIDTQKRMYNELGVYAIPHVILVDPQGIVRWEGYPLGTEKLTEKIVEDIIKKYKK